MILKYQIWLNILNMAKYAMKDKELWKEELSVIKSLKDFIYEDENSYFELKGNNPF